MAKKKATWNVWIDSASSKKADVRVCGPNKDANAKLILAAPDLLEAAQAVLGEFMNDDNWACLGSGECTNAAGKLSGNQGGMTCQECVVERLRELLRPAVEKATGK